jgi:hypothetical protein
MLSICSLTEGSWIVYLQCGLFLCVFSWLDCLHLLSQMGQLNGLSPVRVISCFFKPLDVEDLSHWKQLNGLSPLWVLSSFVKICKICCHTVWLTLWGAEWFITSVGSFMHLQDFQSCAFVATLEAAERFFTSMGSFVFQDVFSWASVGTIGTT